MILIWKSPGALLPGVMLKQFSIPYRQAAEICQRFCRNQNRAQLLQLGRGLAAVAQSVHRTPVFLEIAYCTAPGAALSQGTLCHKGFFTQSMDHSVAAQCPRRGEGRIKILFAEVEYKLTHNYNYGQDETVTVIVEFKPNNAL